MPCQTIKTNRGPQDATGINVNEDYEVTYWTEKFGVSAQRLRDAWDKVGVSAEAVERELKR
jgi:hypothetical protein